MLSLAELIQASDPKVLEKGHRVDIFSLRKGTSRSTKLPKALANTRSPDTPQGMWYTTAIDYDGPRAMKLSCSCPHFVFYLEKPLHEAESADLMYSRQLSPDKYKGKKVGMCAHVYGLILKLQEDGNL